MKSFLLERFTERILHGGTLSPEEALELLNTEDSSQIDELISQAGEVTRVFHGQKAGLCSIINAKSGLCGEDCAFCAQSVRFHSPVARYPLLDARTVLASAREAEEKGCDEFCIVTSGAALNENEFADLLKIVAVLKKEVSIPLDVSIGFLTLHEARQLKRAGIRRVNHNLQTSRRYYAKIVSTHDYSRRLETLRACRRAELEICSGVILGVGESRQDRVDAAFELAQFQPECVPMNFLDPRPGTPLAHEPHLEVVEILKTIAAYRFILPFTNLRLAGGRKLQLGSHQKLALRAGANGLIVGKLLTTAGSPWEEDKCLLGGTGDEN